MTEQLHGINVVVKRTGLSVHLIRVWEKRYGAVRPERTETKRRLYSEDQIERLKLLKQLTEAGQGIGHVAKLPTVQLRALAALAAAGVAGCEERGRTEAALGTLAESVLQRALEAVRGLDAETLERELREAEQALGGQGLLRRVVAPLAQRIGEAWWTGDLTAAHEHFASSVLRASLARMAGGQPLGVAGPVLVVATPAGQLHELGALLVAAFAAQLGWRVTYLGACLPAAEIAGAACQCGARAVALSLVYPEDDPQLAGELLRLRAGLPASVALLAGGRAAGAYAGALSEAGALRGEALEDLCGLLTELRAAGGKGQGR